MMEKSSSPLQCILVTGANGFMGSHVIDALLMAGYSVKALVRSPWKNAPHGVECIVADLSTSVDWGKTFDGVGTIIHLAARVHQMHELPQTAPTEYRRINTCATLELADQAAKAGVKHFIYLSTMAVNGSHTKANACFNELSAPNPISSYAISKYEAELGLQKLAQQYPMQVTTIRPPMVYGKNAPGNFMRLVSLIKTGVPLPFSLAKNLRSFIFIDNLVSFILTCIARPAAGHELYLISDDDDLSLNELIVQISCNLNVRVKMFPIPLVLLEGILKILGKGGLANQLLKPMRMDISKARNILGWRAPISAADGLRHSLKD
jgi:nucleoside-diphosphate-sugar epimerase